MPGAGLHTRADGSPMTLMMVHHFGGSGRCWSEVAVALGPRFDCRTPDLAGFGGSLAAAGHIDLDAYADQIETDATEPYTLVGHSMGAKIGMKLAARRPPLLQSMILVAPSPPTPEPMEEDDRRAMLDEFGDLAKAGARIDKITAKALREDLRRMCAQDQAGVDEGAWRWWLLLGSRMDISASLGGCGLPVLVIAAENDPVLPLASTYEVARAFPGSEFRILPCSGHLAPLEEPEALAALIAEFLTRPPA